MRKVRIAIVPQPVPSEPVRRRDTLREALRREWRGLLRAGSGGYSEA